MGLHYNGKRLGHNDPIKGKFQHSLVLQEAILKKRAEVSSQHQPMMSSCMLGLQPTTECIIKPVSGQARLTRNCSAAPLRISDGPRLHLDVRLEEIPISLSDDQYRLLLKLAGSFKMRLRASRFRRWRPVGVAATSVAGNERAWWRFATEAAVSRIRRRYQRRSLQFALKRARQNVVYVRGYTQHLTEVRAYTLYEKRVYNYSSLLSRKRLNFQFTNNIFSIEC